MSREVCYIYIYACFGRLSEFDLTSWNILLIFLQYIIMFFYYIYIYIYIYIDIVLRYNVTRRLSMYRDSK